MAELPTARPPMTVRLTTVRLLHCAAASALALAVGVVAGMVDAGTQPASAQLAFPAIPKSAKRPRLPQQNGQDQMLVQAKQVDYDYANKRVAAVGNVQIVYQGSSLEADRVVYDEGTKRLHAEGRVRLTEEDGSVTVADSLDLNDQFRDGFVDSLHVETTERTRLAATRANRTEGNFTVFDNGVYTACEPCKDDPKKPPKWQVKAARVVHDQEEKMMYFEQAQLEVYGLPIAYFPYFSAPDPTVKRKTGFLIPTVGYSKGYGATAQIPFYWAIAPNYDATFSPVFYSRQGVLLQGQYQQAFSNGSISITAAGISQRDPGYFGVGSPGNTANRGSIESTGKFALNDKWIFGWQGVAMSDRTFMMNYSPSLSSYSGGRDPSLLGLPLTTEAVSQAYLTGIGDRSYFDARTMYFYGYSSADSQKQLPVIHPVIDYDYTFKNSIVGGELSYKMNFTSLSRQNADFTSLSSTFSCTMTADPAFRNNCLLRGIPGTYSRLSGETTWKRSITDSFGQVFTPFAKLRVDTAAMSIDNQPGVSSYLPTGDSTLVRAMPTVGMEYRYPFISVHSWGTQTFEPIAQVIARPNETQIGRWPNEDAQSFIFDDSNLLKIDKFSGWDRVEGGGRANVAAQYTVQANQGGSVTALFGQSYRLFGQNSFGASDLTNTGLNSGIDSNVSDYVARLSFRPNSAYSFSSRFRFDKNNFAVQRMELEAQATYGRWSLSETYGDYAAQPGLGILNRRQGLLSSASYKLNENWLLFGSALYDLNANKFQSTAIGAGYIDDCFILAVNYSTGYSYDVTGASPTKFDQVMLQLSLRTLGDQMVSQKMSSSQ